MHNNSSTCSKVMGIIRILLGLLMIYMGVMKIFLPAEMHAMVGGAALKLGFTFFSAEVWFWIATVGEILGGLFLFTGHWYKIGAVITLIIMIFAINAMGAGWLPVATAIASIAVLVWGAGSWRICHGRCCMGGNGGCCGNCKGSKDGKGCTCGSEHHQHMDQPKM